MFLVFSYQNCVAQIIRVTVVKNNVSCFLLSELCSSYWNIHQHAGHSPVIFRKRHYSEVSNQKLAGLRPNKKCKSNRSPVLVNSEFNKKMEILKEWKIEEPQVALNLLSLPSEEMEYISKKSGRKLQEKIEMLAHALECSHEDSALLFAKYKFLIRSNIRTLEAKISFLTKGGVSKEELMKDLWILSYTLVKLEKRLQQLKDMKISPLKPWLLRCHPTVLRRKWLNQEENNAALNPHKTTEEFLCWKLQMNKNEVDNFSRKHPPVMRVNVAKMKEIIDFLLSEGFSPAQIYNTPRVLCHSLNTIQIRLETLRGKKIEPYSLSVLCKSQKTFCQILKKLSRITESDSL